METKERISKIVKAEKGYLICPFCGNKKYASVLVKCLCPHQVWEDNCGNAEYKGHRPEAETMKRLKKDEYLRMKVRKQNE
jgi:hypothetical protein